MTTTDPNAPDAALLWAQSTRDTHHSEHRTRERAEAHRAGQAHERRADAGLLAALEPFAKWFDACQAMARFTGGDLPKPATVMSSIHGAHPAELRWRDFVAARAAITAAKGHDNAE